MKWCLLFLGAALIISNRAMAQNYLKKDSSAVTCNYGVQLEEFPCDSLYKIKSLKNVKCGDYAVVTLQDIRRVDSIFHSEDYYDIVRKKKR